MLGKTVQRGMIRHLMGRFFAHLVGLMIDSNVYDSQCGLKVLPGDFYKKIRNNLCGERFAFDVELIAAIQRARLKSIEVPIDWNDVAGSKVSFLKDPLKMILSLMKIKKRMLLWM